MKIDIKKITSKLGNVFQKIRKYSVFVFFVVILLIFSFLVFRINILARTEPSEDAVNEKLQTIKRPKIDQDSIDKLQALQDNSVEVQTLFQQARENPFHE